MTKYIIVNADDFGYTEGVTKGIIEAHKNGIVTSTSLMVDSDYAKEAAELAKKYPKLGIGLHFTATDCRGKILFDLDDVNKVREELNRQYKKFCKIVGKQPTHLDSHHHIHMQDNLKPLFLGFAEEYCFPLRHSGTINYNGGFYGQWYDEKGNPNPCHECISAENLKKILQNIPEGISEICCHPGYVSSNLNDHYNKEREVELTSLLDSDVAKLIYKLDIELINFSKVWSALFPDNRTLIAGFNSIFGKNKIRLINRKPNIYASTFPTEIVTCKLNDGRKLHLFCKYGAGKNYNDLFTYGHRGGIMYESEVYNNILNQLCLSKPKFYGSFNGVKGQTLLILENINTCMRIGELSNPTNAMKMAANWLGKFHNANQNHISDVKNKFLRIYNAQHYIEMAHKTSVSAGRLHYRFPWLLTLCERFEKFINQALIQPDAIIHNEFCTENILVHDGEIYPVDWESTTIAMGEMDLASLIDGWPKKIAQQCELEYQRARWPNGSPSDFEKRLWTARLYLQLLWLGDMPYWTTLKGNSWRFRQMHLAGKRLGLI